MNNVDAGGPHTLDSAENILPIADFSLGGCYAGQPFIKLREIPYFGRFFREFDLRVSQRGLIQASKQTVDTIGAEGHSYFMVVMPPETREVLASGPVLIVGNHPKRFDPLFLFAALEERRDFYAVARSVFGSIGPATRQQLIPVFHRSKSVKDSVRPAVRYHLSRFAENSYHDDTKKALNQAAIRNAALRLGEGGAVAIFPGAHYLLTGWQTGVGRIIHECGSVPSLPIVFACIEGSVALDPFVRQIPFLSGNLTPVRVTFSTPYDASHFHLDDNPATTTRLMENEYSWWAEANGLNERKLG